MYRFSSLVCVRLAGVPFEVLDAMGTPGVFAAVRAVIAAERELDEAASETWTALGDEREGSIRNRMRRAIKSRRQLPDDTFAARFPRYAGALVTVGETRARLEQQFATEDVAVRERLERSAREVLPDFLVFQSADLLADLRGPHANESPSERRRREQHLAMYLQRVVAKNDTINRFGPTSWGTIRPNDEPFAIVPQAGIARREVTIERWVVGAAVAAINADPTVREELCPRRHPDVALVGSRYVHLGKGCEYTLSAADIAVLERVDGSTPAYRIDAPRQLEQLANEGAIIWSLELVAWDSEPLATLRADVERWRDGEPRRRWIHEIERLEAAAADFARTLEPEARAAIQERVRAHSIELGGKLPQGRSLYQARNPVMEECVRATDLVLDREMMSRLASDIAPWIDLFRDSLSFGASRCYEALRELHATAPRRDGEVGLPAFLAHCDANQFSLVRGGATATVNRTYETIKAELAAHLAERGAAAELVLSTADCELVRRLHPVPRADEFTLAAPDLQLAATSLDAIARGDFTWLVAELHTHISMLQRGIDWSCPDVAALRDAVASFAGGKPWLVHERIGATLTVVKGAPEKLLDLVPKLTYASPIRGKAGWRTVAPTAVTVVVDEQRHDLRLRANGEDVGSLVRTPWFAMGMHPFIPIDLGDHTPRVRVGKAIVQREMWRIAVAEVECRADAPPHAALVAIERMRARRSLPRHVYIRPSTATLTRTAIHRDKDVKPLYVDLESTIYADIFLRRLQQYGQLEVVEMLPTPEQLCWREADGRYCFELRCLCSPAT